jgi:hypothetical protein
MTPRQKSIIWVLAIANGAVILALVVFVARFSPEASPTLLPSAAPPDPSGGPSPALSSVQATSPSTSSGQRPGQAPPGALSWEECQQRAVRLLSQGGLGGTATLVSDRTLRLALVYPIPKDQTVEQAAQQVWTAFDIAQALTQDQCNDFFHVTVVIQGQGAQSSIQIRANVDAADLEAFYGGELSEGEFIDRVQYEAEPVNRQ